MRVLSRQELFDMAWERPLTKVAAGGVFPKPALSPVQRKGLETIRIVGAPTVSEAVQRAAAKARARMAEPASQAAPVRTEVEPDLEPAQAQAFDDSRPDLAATVKAIAKAKAKPGEFAHISGKGVVPMTITPAVAERHG